MTENPIDLLIVCRSQARLLAKEMNKLPIPYNHLHLYLEQYNTIRDAVKEVAYKQFSCTEINTAIVYLDWNKKDIDYDFSKEKNIDAAIQRLEELQIAVTRINEYLDIKVGNPVAHDLLSDDIKQARELYHEGDVRCSHF